MNCLDCQHWSAYTSCCVYPARDKRLFEPEQCPHFETRSFIPRPAGLPVYWRPANRYHKSGHPGRRGNRRTV